MKQIKIYPMAPYDFEKSLILFKKSESQPPTYIIGNKFRRIFWDKDIKYLIEIESIGKTDSPLIQIKLLTSDKEDLPLSIVDRVSFILNSNLNLNILYQEFQEYPQLDTLREELFGYKPLLFPSPFEALVNGIIEQQISIKVANIIKARILNYFDEKVHFENSVYFAFPPINFWRDVPISILREAGLTNQKAQAIIEVSNLLSSTRNFLKTNNGIFEQESLLLHVKGIGPWTINFLRWRGFGDSEAVPINDLALRKGICHFFLLDNANDNSEIINLLNSISNNVGLSSYYFIASHLLKGF